MRGISSLSKILQLQQGVTLSHILYSNIKKRKSTNFRLRKVNSSQNRSRRLLFASPLNFPLTCTSHYRT